MFSVVSLPIGDLTRWLQPVLLHAFSIEQFTCTTTDGRVSGCEGEKVAIDRDSLEHSRRTLIHDGALTWCAEGVQEFQSHMTTVIALDEDEDLMQIVDERVIGMDTHMNLEQSITGSDELIVTIV